MLRQFPEAVGGLRQLPRSVFEVVRFLPDTLLGLAGSRLRKKKKIPKTCCSTFSYFRNGSGISESQFLPSPASDRKRFRLSLSSVFLSPRPPPDQADSPVSALWNRLRSAVSGQPRLSRGKQEANHSRGRTFGSFRKQTRVPHSSGSASYGVKGPPSRPECARLFPPGGGPEGLEPRRRRLTQGSRGCGDGGRGGGDGGRSR